MCGIQSAKEFTKIYIILLWNVHTLCINICYQDKFENTK